MDMVDGLEECLSITSTTLNMVLHPKKISNSNERLGRLDIDGIEDDICIVSNKKNERTSNTSFYVILIFLVVSNTNVVSV